MVLRDKPCIRVAGNRWQRPNQVDIEDYAEGAAEAGTVGVHINLTTVRLHDRLDDIEAQADALMVVLGRAHELPEASEELGDLICLDAHARVPDLHRQQVLRGAPVEDGYLNHALHSELNGVAD
eukprot:CAMPEP_0185569610 /NCGR_PEP_ID=MMETSP0434-20130131/2182_1 /TAXON_ID=626734 ORGANISM="Favella taraikaensis, Strain Fe Narragansett Bay" /NCGR_SAMPLE_ID=MMETSP0434 /ASSEMBLY_ACC=CAM_ASM_000379 /LENGTH=123 /DNA_ID=CAMNT_0028184449 /DNA_START=858 /DNA_END=1229 /DNA_ORIENTATION=+